MANNYSATVTWYDPTTNGTREVSLVVVIVDDVNIRDAVHKYVRREREVGNTREFSVLYHTTDYPYR